MHIEIYKHICFWKVSVCSVSKFLYCELLHKYKVMANLLDLLTSSYISFVRRDILRSVVVESLA